MLKIPNFKLREQNGQLKNTFHCFEHCCAHVYILATLELTAIRTLTAVGRSVGRFGKHVAFSEEGPLKGFRKRRLKVYSFKTKLDFNIWKSSFKVATP